MQKAWATADEGDVVVPSAPGAAFVVVQARASSQFAVVVFDAPAQLGQPHQPGAWGVVGQVRQPVFDRFGRAGGPFGDQQAQGEFPRAVGASDLAPGGPDGHDHEAGPELPAAGAFPPRHRLDLAAADGQDQLTHRLGAGAVARFGSAAHAAVGDDLGCGVGGVGGGVALDLHHGGQVAVLQAPAEGAGGSRSRRPRTPPAG